MRLEDFPKIEIPIKDRKQIILNRKLPHVVRVPYDINYKSLLELMPTKNTVDEAIKERNNQPDYLAYDDYSAMGSYQQRHLNSTKDFGFGFGEMYHVRFAIIEPGKELPTHFDSPHDLRFIIMLQGEHLYHVEGKTYHMKEGESWFVNASYLHSVENTGDVDRIAILAKCKATKENREKIMEWIDV